MTPEPTVLLVDALGLAYRGHFAFARNPLRAADGRPTSAVFSFLMTLLPLLEQDPPAYAAAAFDPAGPTFRDELAAEYKATRQPMPDDLFLQLDTIKEFLAALGVHVLEIPGYEADDVLASVACRAADRGWRAVIVTIDKDLCQIVNDRISVIVPPRSGGKPARLDPAGVREKFGVPPERVTDLLALVGDTVDNVPGVPGIGIKTAAKLIEEFGTLDDIFARLPDVKPDRIRGLLEAHRETAFLSRTLVTLDCRMPLEVDVDGLRLGSRDAHRLRALCEDMSFRGLATRLAGAEAPAEEALLAKAVGEVAVETPPSAGETVTLATREDLARYLDAEPGTVGVGLAGARLGPRDVRLDALALSGTRAGGAVARLGVGSLTADAIVEALAARPAAGRGRAVTWNIKTVMHLVSDEQVDAAAEIDDLRLMVAADGYRDPLHEEPASVSRSREDALFLRAPDGRKSAAIPLGLNGEREAADDEAADDEAALAEARIVPRLFGAAETAVGDGPRRALYRDLERPLTPALVRMERRGVRLDVGACAALSASFAVDLARTAEEIYRLAGERFNIQSVPELRAVLFERLRLPTRHRTKTGFSTDADALEELAAEHPIARLILDWRQVAKLRSTYLEALPRLVDPRTGRIHTTYHQLGAATGRLSSTDPNLQNIPIRWEAAREIRRAFVPGPPGWRFVGADYSQIELRLLAHLSGEPTLVESFRAGEDVHARTAALVAHVPVGEVTPGLRAIAKTVNFAVIYGQSAFGLARQLGLALDEARAYIDEFFRQRPALSSHLAETVAEARTRGYTETILGRRRYFRDLASPNPARRQAAERAAVNAPLQGSAADLIKCATIRVDRRLRREGLAAGLVLQVHDELVCEAPPEEAGAVARVLREEMEGAMELDVPLLVEVGEGASWFEVH